MVKIDKKLMLMWGVIIVLLLVVLIFPKFTGYIFREQNDSELDKENEAMEKLIESQSQAELPTMRGFITENSIVLVILLILLDLLHLII